MFSQDTIDWYQRRVEELEAENARLLALVRRYRTETPLGHQPHMIADEADAALWGRPQPGADWRERCPITEFADGKAYVESPCGQYWLTKCKHWTTTATNWIFDSKDQARAVLAACPTRPPGVGQ